MKRHYFVGDNLKDLESIEAELERKGITTLQIHVLSQHDAGVERHRLNAVASFLKQDVVHSTLFGAAIGVVTCILILALVHAAGLTSTAAGWIPFIFLGVVLLGFCAWEGGLRGIQEFNHRFQRFQKVLQEGRHVFFVDVDDREEGILKQVVAKHPDLEAAGVEKAGAHWVVACEQKCLNFIKALP